MRQRLFSRVRPIATEITTSPSRTRAVSILMDHLTRRLDQGSRSTKLLLGGYRVRPSCSGRLVATIRTFGGCNPACALWDFYARTTSYLRPFQHPPMPYTETCSVIFEHSTSFLEAERDATFASATTLLLECRHVLVPRHVPTSVQMPPH